MDRETINSTLSDILAQMGSAPAIKKLLKMLPLTSLEQEIPLRRETDFDEILKAIELCGTILEARSREQYIEALIFSGIARMNPAIVQICLAGDKIHITAYAKEGLIKQHTGEETLALFQEALQHVLQQKEINQERSQS